MSPQPQTASRMAERNPTRVADRRTGGTAAAPPALVGLATDLVHRFRSVVVGERTGGDPAGAACDHESLATEVESAYRSGRAFRFPTAGRPELAASSPSQLEVLAEEALTYREPLLDLFARHLYDLSAWNRALADGSGVTVTETSLRLHGPLPDTLVADAERVVALPVSPLEELGTFDAGTVAGLFGELLAEVDAVGWSVRVQPGLRARLAVRPSSRMVLVASDAVFAGAELARLAVHEVGTHVLRAVAGQRQAVAVYGVGCGTRGLCAEEGLAVWAEQQAGLLDATTMRRYALRVQAVRHGMDLPFGDLYAVMRGWCDPREAYQLCRRVKQPLADWNEPGAYLKDKVYLEGLHLVSGYTADETSRRLLWSGKVSPFDLDTEVDPLFALEPGPDPLPLHDHLVEFTQRWVLSRSAAARS